RVILALHSFPTRRSSDLGVRPYTSSYDLAQPCVFAKQSPGPFHCAHALAWGPFSRSYRAILPSSLATNHSSTLGFSLRIPVSVRSEEHTSELQSRENLVC